MVRSYEMTRIVLFMSIDDPRFAKILKLSKQFEYINVSEGSYSSCVICFTSDRSNALNVTLTGLFSLIKLLLNHDFRYVFSGNF